MPQPLAGFQSPPDDLAGRSSLLRTVAPVGLRVERWGRQMRGGPLSLLSVGISGSVSV